MKKRVEMEKKREDREKKESPVEKMMDDDGQWYQLGIKVLPNKCWEASERCVSDP